VVTTRLKGTGEPLTSDCCQSDLYVCPTQGADTHKPQFTSVGN
jgi:hypothetical protein